MSSPFGEMQIAQLNSARQRPSSSELHMGMIGFDIACAIVRSGSRMQGYLVNDLCKKQVPIQTALSLLTLTPSRPK
jgi:hypothetical protein